MASFSLPDGSAVYIGSKMAASIIVSAVSNAKGAEFTVDSATDLAVGDIVLITSGWDLIDNIVAKISAKDTDSVTIEEIDTSDVNFFPAGGGVGSIRKITEWVEIPNIDTVESSGGEQQYATVQFLRDTRQRNIPTFKNAVTQSYNFAHDYTLALYDILKNADLYAETVAFKMDVPKAKEVILWSGTPSFNGIPSTSKNQVRLVTLSVALKSQGMTHYPMTVI